MERDYFVQKHRLGSGEALDTPRPLYGDAPFKPLIVTDQGVEAVAGVLGIESPSAAFEQMPDAPPEERLAEAIRRLTQR